MRRQNKGYSTKAVPPATQAELSNILGPALLPDRPPDCYQWEYSKQNVYENTTHTHHTHTHIHTKNNLTEITGCAVSAVPGEELQTFLNSVLITYQKYLKVYGEFLQRLSPRGTSRDPLLICTTCLCL